ncbi:MAG: addiction module protein [Planctomycetota bacterium]|nr:addiction module protein [Planctomycetota bacterium]
MNPDISQIFELPLPDQLRIVEDLWDHIAASKEPLPIPDWQKEELDRRKRTFEANPESVIPWQDAKKQIRGKDD